MAGLSAPIGCQVIRRLGVGGMGEVFLCLQDIGGARRFVVQKRLLPEIAEDEQVVALFLDEARITAQLRHPGIVQVYDFGHDRDGYFLTMEYVPGQTLGRVLARAVKQARVIAPAIGAHLVLEIARALDHAHHARDVAGQPLDIVHRDITPSNVMVSYAGDVKLMDFGIAKASGRATRTRTGVVRGTTAYMSPEQLSGSAVDARSDVFSLGVLLWELTMMRPLFRRDNEPAVIQAVLGEPIPSPTSLVPDYPARLERIVMNALLRDRERRTANAAALAAALKDFLGDLAADRDDVASLMSELFPEEAHVRREAAAHTPPAASEDAPTVDLKATTKPRRRVLGAVVAAITLGAIATAGVAWITAQGDEPEVTIPVASPAMDAHVAVAVAVAPPDAAAAPVAPVDVPVDAMPAAPTRPTHAHPHPAPSVDAGTGAVAVAVPVASPPATGTVMLKATGTDYYRPKGLSCTMGTTPTVCTLAPGAQHITLELRDGRTMQADVTVIANRRVTCTVTPKGAQCGEPR